MPAVAPSPLLESLGALPTLWPDQVTLSFEVPASGRSRFLADPIRWVGGRPAPVLSGTSDGYRTWVWGGNGSFIPDGRPRTANEMVRYVQLWRPEADEDLSTPFSLIDVNVQSVLHPLRQNPVPKVKQYADQLIERMVADGRLPADHHNRVSMLPRNEFHDTIAQALSSHLATTPTLSYTTDLRRSRKDVDPVEDFLFHTRAGHCERFASALVLMLRSQGIPAVLVLGFKGCEPTEEPGKYVVRQAHAHAWVEALIEDFQPRPWWDVFRPSRWRSLDPTPAGDSSDTAGNGWLDRSASQIRRLYNTYVTDYTPEQRMRAIAGAIGAVVPMGGPRGRGGVRRGRLPRSQVRRPAAGGSADHRGEPLVRSPPRRTLPVRLHSPVRRNGTRVCHAHGRSGCTAIPPPRQRPRFRSSGRMRIMNRASADRTSPRGGSPNWMLASSSCVQL